MSIILKQTPPPEGIRRVAVVIAHPDDEILWAGGLLLSHPEWSPFIVTLCGGLDPDQVSKFNRVLECLNAQGVMGELDDVPNPSPLPATMVRAAIRSLLPNRDYDLVLTHAPCGEYTRHRRHEEVSRAVRILWQRGDLRSGKMWQFAYEDDGGNCFPRPRVNADFNFPLSDHLWNRKCELITDIYGFDADSWEARVASRMEAFHCFERQPI
jgi:LmbE family N-acetylglucosaminyl deacetylase